MGLNSTILRCSGIWPFFDWPFHGTLHWLPYAWIPAQSVQWVSTILRCIVWDSTILIGHLMALVWPSNSSTHSNGFRKFGHSSMHFSVGIRLFFDMHLSGFPMRSLVDGILRCIISVGIRPFIRCGRSIQADLCLPKSKWIYVYLWIYV